MYKSPIELLTADMAASIAKIMDNNVLQAVLATGVIVDEKELRKALEYDRDQYNKGYNDGYAEGMIAMKNKIEETLVGMISSKLLDIVNNEMVGKKENDQT